MDSAAFSTWRAEIRGLTATQRGLAFFDLALAEADDPIERPDDEIGQTAQPDEIGRAPAAVAATAVGPAVEEKPEPELLSKVGRDRIAGFGCPHCGDFAIGAWGRANGMPRYRCKACRKTFTPLTGTPLSGLHYKDRWIDQARALISARVHREGGAALRDRSHDGVPVASPLSFRSQPRQAEVSIGHSRGGRDIHSGIFQGPA